MEAEQSDGTSKVASCNEAVAGWVLQEKLGEGSFGKVFKAWNEATSQVAAVKIVPVEQDTSEVAREIETLRQCSSPNIVRYYGSIKQGPELWIMMEFCAGSSLSDIMEARGRCLNEAQIAGAVAGTLDGLEYLHNLNHIHRDVKAGNLLLSESGVIKLADFGVSAQIGNTISRRGTVIGTPFWMAPEVILGDPKKGYNTKADMWSLGITSIELAEGQPPLSELHPMRAIFLIPTKPSPTFSEPERWSSDLIEFVALCLRKEPDERPSSADLSSHPFVVAGREAQDAGVLKKLMDAALEPLSDWRERVVSEAMSTRPGGLTQELDLNTLKVGSAAPNTPDAGTMVFKGGTDSGTAAFSSSVASGTTVFRGDREYGTTVIKEGAAHGTTIFKGNANCGTTIVSATSNGSVPAFMRQFEQNVTPTRSPMAASVSASTISNSTTGGDPGSSSRVGVSVRESDAFSSTGSLPSQEPLPALGTATSTPPKHHAMDVPDDGDVDRSVVAQQAASAPAPVSISQKTGKYDFSHLTLQEIDEEIRNQQANFERDVGLLRKQYERRGRALRRARAAKESAGAS